MTAQMPQDIVLRPVVTEKTLKMAERENTYTFRVANTANKVQIRDAIERLFKVDVVDVRTQNYLGKARRVGRVLRDHEQLEEGRRQGQDRRHDRVLLIGREGTRPCLSVA